MKKKKNRIEELRNLELQELKQRLRELEKRNGFIFAKQQLCTCIILVCILLC